MRVITYIRNLKLRGKIIWGISILFLILYLFSLPENLFKTPTSSIVLSSDGQLLSANIADDGQWRFPQMDSVPDKFYTSICRFEDNYFKYHPGINPVSIARAAYLNIKKGEIVSGGSTITMQVCRMYLNNSNRSVLNKMHEMIMATRLELKFSKDEIMQIYASNAPFGGNIVGLDAAAWRYFNRSPFELSWAEAATLAVLPNAPSIIRPGKNQDQLLKKRNRLLKTLLENEDIDTITYQVSLQEKLPQKTYALPNFAVHLNNQIEADKHKKLTSIDYGLQKRTFKIINQYAKKLSYNKIHSAAIIILDVKTAKVLAYHGNISPYLKEETYGRHNDIIKSVRSSGSTLKPLLYAAMQDDGSLLPEMLMPDVPSNFGGFRPENFNEKYSGLVAADEALARSLNIPAALMLKKYGVLKFHDLLQKTGISSINRSAKNYGLSLILGGAEISLWELSGAYASMARSLNNFYETNDDYDYWRMPHFSNEDVEFPKHKNEILSAGAIYLSFNAMLDVNRPPEESGWELFSSSRKVAWKTGTSFGFRDAWAVGVTPEYVVGVWVGNADGEGRPGMTGLTAAAPLLFNVFNILPQTSWFEKPVFDLRKAKICKNTGYIAQDYCPAKEAYVSKNYDETAKCPYHKKLHLDEEEKYQVHSDCYEVNKIQTKPYLVIPPVYEHFYKISNPNYKTPPPFHPDCMDERQIMEFIYPSSQTKIYIPKSFSGIKNTLVFEAAHLYADKTIYWHLDNKYLGKTKGIHQMKINAEKGIHKIVLTDEDGNAISKRFEVVNR